MIEVSTRRKKKRGSIDDNVSVIDVMSGDELGKLVNISRDGFMLFGRNALNENGIYQLELHCPALFGSLDPLVIGAECLWTRKDESDMHTWAGFNVLDISPEAIALVEALLKDIGSE